MSELKTKINDASVTDFLNNIKDEAKRADSFEISKVMRQVTKQEPKMWGSSIVGFGSQHLKYESGRELDWFIIGFLRESKTSPCMVWETGCKPTC